MKIRRPRSLNGLILVGFGLVALPLLVAVIWAMVSLGQLAVKSEALIGTGVAVAENNRLLSENLGSLERVARQYQVLKNPDSMQLLQEDLATIERQLADMALLIDQAEAADLARLIRMDTRQIVATLASNSLTDDEAAAAIAGFSPVRQEAVQLSEVLSNHVDS